jgi:glucokinase
VKTGNAAVPIALGLDLGGSSFKWVIVARDGTVIEKGTLEFDAAKPKGWAEEIKSLVGRIATEPAQGLAGIAVSAPGLAAKDGRSIAYMPGRLAGLEGLNWKDFLAVDFEVPVLNDAHAALLGEVWLGAAKGCANVVMLTLGTGVGGAAMVDGRLLRGAIGRAGHLGHVTLDPNGPPDVTNMPGSLEMAIGNCSIPERTNGRFKTTHELLAAHENGDAGATAIWLKAMRDLAFAIAGFINCFDPEIVLIGGGIARAGRSLFVPLEGYLRPIEWQPGGHTVPVKPAELGEFAGAFGAASRAWNCVESSAK